MGPLESLGFDVAASRLMETHIGVGRLLRLLIKKSPVPIGADSLASMMGDKTEETVRTYACLLRRAMSDLGIPCAVVCEDGAYRLEGETKAIIKAVERASQ